MVRCDFYLFSIYSISVQKKKKKENGQEIETIQRRVKISYGTQITSLVRIKSFSNYNIRRLGNDATIITSQYTPPSHLSL